MREDPAARLGGYLRANPQLVVSALIVMAILWSLASVVRSGAPSLHAAATHRLPAIDLQSIRAAHLFGIADAETGAADDGATGPVPLVLVGTLANNDKALALAIVRAGDQPTARIFRVGDRLPGGAVLLEVTPHSILVERDGGAEALAFPRRFGAALAALRPGAVEELAETDAGESPRLYTTPPGSAKVEDYYAEQQAALLRGAGGS